MKLTINSNCLSTDNLIDLKDYVEKLNGISRKILMDSNINKVNFYYLLIKSR